jgi:hypothetical protein
MAQGAQAREFPPDARRESNERAAAAHYVATLAGDLAAIAHRHGLDTLGYILEMARLEAENISRVGPGGS